MSKLECKDLSVYFGETCVLKDVSLSFESGEITALIGPSGCGKTTFLKCFNRINELSKGFKAEGEILLDGESIRAMPAQQLRRTVGMVFQRPTPFSMSIYNNIVFGPRGNGIKDKRKLDEIVERSLQDAFLWKEVKDRLHVSALGLSGGQQQRLCIARALAVSPKVLLLDEPTSALDPISTEHIQKLMISLRGKLTMLLVSHNIHQVRSVCRNTAYFEQGRLVEYGPTEQLFTAPHSKKTAAYLKQ